MNWLSGISPEDKKEMIDDSCAAYEAGTIEFKEFCASLGKLGLNATEIYEYEKQFRPKGDLP